MSESEFSQNRARGKLRLCEANATTVFMKSRCASQFQSLSLVPHLSAECVSVCAPDSEFDVAKLSRWSARHWEVPCLIVATYIACVLLLQRERVTASRRCTSCLFVWNFGLACFSLRGSIVCVPAYLSLMFRQGWSGSLCVAAETYACNEVGVFIALFVFSKIVELGDTAWIAARHRGVSFLHAYHHTTVLLFCWHSFASGVGGAGLLFAAMNYSVHTIMYLYYALTSFHYARVAMRGISVNITRLQILQMVVGIATSLTVLHTIHSGGACFVSWVNAVLALMMYGSYTFLFGNFYIESYVKGAKAV